MKNVGNATIRDVQAYVLIADIVQDKNLAPGDEPYDCLQNQNRFETCSDFNIATNTNKNISDCSPGTMKVLISGSEDRQGIRLNPDDSATISGSLWYVEDVNWSYFNGYHIKNAVDINCNPTNNLESNQSYIIQIDGRNHENYEKVSFTTNVQLQ